VRWLCAAIDAGYCTGFEITQQLGAYRQVMQLFSTIPYALLAD